MKRLLILALAVFALSACDKEVTKSDTCEDGVLDPGEECDGSNFGGRSCQSFGFYGGDLSCNESCQISTSTCTSEGACGDGIVQVDFDEDCDGSELNNETCYSLGYYGGELSCGENCRFDLSDCTAYGICGDGTLQDAFGEECELGTLGGQTCESLGYYGGQLACNMGSCQFDLSECIGAGECGDGEIQTAHEECDGSNLGNATCQGLGHDGGILTCNPDCTFDEDQCTDCGDGTLNGNEQCDGADLNGETCETQGYYGGTLTCDPFTCMLDFTQCESFGWCGDQDIQASYGEECEGSQLGGADCESLGYHGGQLLCDANCRFNVSQCVAVGSCGDGLLQASYESCDGTDLAGETCESQNHYPGALVCDPSCHFDYASCGGFCGDGVLQSMHGETCDGTDMGASTCELWGHTYGGVLSCTAGCQLDLSGCYGWCGDDLAQTAFGESCDGTDLAGNSCIFGGTLGCDGSCEVRDTSCDAMDFITVSAHIASTPCALRSNGEVYCWGANASGQVGDNSTTERHSPVAVVGGHQFIVLSTGYNTNCGIVVGGAMYCWGSNGYGALGDNRAEWESSIPVPVSGGHLFKAVSVGSGHTCGVTTTDELYCWGHNNYGQVGDGTNTDRLVPVLVSGGHTFTDVAAGSYHTCGLTDTGDAYCWGNGQYGKLGDGTENNSNQPVLVSGGLSFASIALGNAHTCGLTTSGAAYCWGLGGSGQLGDGANANRLVPTPVSGGLSFTSVACGSYTTCGVAGVNQAYCWGQSPYGQLGDGSTAGHNTPAMVSGPNLYVGVSPGEYHTCGLTISGEAYCWGRNRRGQLGTGTTTDSLVPMRITTW